jgi:glycogen debranching enzyme
VASARRAAVLRATDLTGVHVLKHDQLVLLTDAFGDVQTGSRALGLYQGDTRVLSLYELRLNGTRPVVLRAGAAAGYRSTIQLTNPDLFHSPTGSDDSSEMVLRRHSLGVVRERVMSGGLRERVTVHNFTTAPERARITLRLDADYADIFEVRGFVRDQRGDRLPNEGDGGRVGFGYRGLDGRSWRTNIAITPGMALLAPSAQVTPTGELADGEQDPIESLPAEGAVLLEVDWTLPPGAERTLEMRIWGEVEEKGRHRSARAAAEPPQMDDQAPSAMHRAWRSSSASIETSHLFARRAIERALADLRLLINDGPAEGERYVAAGVPWFSCLFGRDSLITALQTLAIRPQVAQDTLAILARLQSTTTDDWRDAQPGKILHELRAGELARTGEIPHTPYFGTVDATPLWLVLLDEYHRWTGDDQLVEALWPNALACLRWMDEEGDADGDGFIEYERHSRRGLVNQGWKDSADSVRMRDGTLAAAPIALVEVQGYAYAARRGLARLARLRGDVDLAQREEKAAERLREQFEAAFWMEEAGTYALALDANKKQVDAICSNAGHALWSGIASPERAASVARALTGPGMWSGWGIRTLSVDSIGYNPIGYHLGTIWPHDNGIIAAGFARYGLHDEARRVAGALLESTTHFRESRLPELFCGFSRDSSPLPVPYPVACSPQAWAAGSVFHLVSSMLGMRPNALEKRLELVRPALPDWLPDLRIHNLRVGSALVDLRFGGEGGSISVEVLRRSGELDVAVRL